MSNRKALSTAALAAAVGLAGLTHLLPAADAPKAKAGPKDPAAAKAAKELNDKNTFLDPAKATPDFAVQGEYVGQADAEGGGKTTVAAQVASLGGGAFTAAAYTGGLPGQDGWDGKGPLMTTGKATNPAMTEITFVSPDGQSYAVAWAAGTLKGKTPDGRAFELKRVERTSPTMGAKPPAGAVVLFDGTSADQWENGKVDDRGLLAAGANTKRKFKNFALHAEFLLPFKPYGRDQDRGNSGLYLQDRYEVQVLDSFGQPPAFNGTGALYRQTAPDLNMCLPPLQWQTYDIDLTSPEFDAAGAKTKNGVITVKLNGVAVHDKREIKAKTGAGKPEGPEPGPILIQGHGNPVFYRNIWVVEKP